MAIKLAEGQPDVFEKEIAVPPQIKLFKIKQVEFEIKELEDKIVCIQSKIDELKNDMAEALAINKEPVTEDAR